MSALADLEFIKMNGIGNEIIVLDLRGAGVAVIGHRGAGCGLDQLYAASARQRQRAIRWCSAMRPACRP